MIKEIIKSVVEFLEDLSETFKTAYEETYGCEELANEAVREIELRKRKNKDEFIVKAMAQVTKDIYKRDNYLIPPMTAAVIAERLFKEAKENNDIDELNRLIIEEE